MTIDVVIIKNFVASFTKIYKTVGIEIFLVNIVD